MPSELQVETAELSLAGLHDPLAEPEVMLQLGQPDASRPEQLFGKMGLGFEIPASVLPPDAKSTLTGQIIDRAGAGALWVGAVQPFAADQILTPFSSQFYHNTSGPIVGSSSNITGGILGVAMEFIKLAQAHGYALRSGQWIATGGLSPAVSVSPGDRLAFSALGNTVELKLI